ncbi:hyperosmotically inducible protein [Oxalobacteraceae bacterium GrIS 2.11]
MKSNLKQCIVMVAHTLAAGSLVFAISACNKQQYEEGQPTPVAAVKIAAKDAVISTKVREALLASDDIKSFDIKVHSDNGVVSLSGFVNNQNQIDLSIAVAKRIQGVIEVVNQMSVKDATTASNEKMGDDVVTAAVKTALLNDSVLKSFDISVVTRHGEVMLSGFVNDQAQSAHCVDVAQSVEGVSAVVNHTTIKSK